MASYRATHRTAVSVAAVAAFLLSTFVGGDALGAGQLSPPEDGAPAVSKEKPAAASTGRLTRHGVVVDFQVRPAEGRRDRGLVAGQQAEVRFTLQDEATGKPVRGITPGAWMDIGQPAPDSEEASQKSCKDRIALYLKGAVGMRPMIDLNGYYVLVLNREPSISVVDPLVSMVGQTSTLGTIPLKGAGSDWARSADRKRLYVSMPQAGEVAVVDVESFKVHRTIQAGPDPARVALQPDGRYLWVGNDSRATDNSGVTVVDVETLGPAARLATGPGHHEIAFTADSRYAFVSNREAGTVTVVDVAAKRRIKDVSTGPMPIALAWSPLAGALYVADGRDGSVSVLDGSTHEVRARIALKPGLGPMRFTADGRFGMVVNPSDNAVYVFDAAENALVHALEVRGRPYQIALSPAFAYVRALDSERVTMINLSTLGKGRQPIVQGFAAGAAAPREAGDLPLADSIAPLTGMAAVLVVSPADHTTYYYMEGMNAPMSNYRVRGAQARAVTVVDRSLVEVEPGVYAAKVRIPAAGRYDVAFMLDSPQILHCFSVEAKPDPQAKTDRAALKVEYPARDRTAAAGGTFPLRFTLRDLATGNPRTGLADVRVMYFLAPGRNRTEVRAREVGDGVYEALLPVAWPGAYYVHVAVPSEKVGFDDLPYFTMMVTGAAPPPKAKPKAGETE